MDDLPEPIVRVMIVEDDREAAARFAAAMSGDRRLRVEAIASTGGEALALLAGKRPDVLLVDLGLPDMRGTEVIRRAAQTLPDCDVMVITVFGDERSVLDSIGAGATGYVLKDQDAADLVAAVLELRSGGAPMTPRIARLVLNCLAARRNPAQQPAAAGNAEGADGAALLTARETRVLSLLSRGYTYAEIGEHLGISRHTVTSHIKNSYRKLAVHTGAAAVTRASELGLLHGTEGADSTGR